MPSAEIITIGTEILLGEILDSNAQYLARNLRDLGIDLYRKTTIGDNANRIAQAIQEACLRCEIILTTGGLGPTIDDPTREAVALALGVQTEFRSELWEQIQERFTRYGRQPTDNNRRQAYIPHGALVVENPVGTAPSFIMETDRHAIISLPGVPREMETLLQDAIIPYLRQRYGLTGTIRTRILHTSGVGESMIDERIADLEMLSNPTVGLAAHSGQVDVRITAKADSEIEVNRLIHELEIELRLRLGDWVYGADQETLESAAMHNLDAKGWSVAVVEAGLGGELIRRLAKSSVAFRGGEVLPAPPALEQMHVLTEAFQHSHQAEVGLGAVIYPGTDKQDIHFIIITPTGREEQYRPYGGPPSYAPRWAVHLSLDIIRRLGGA